MSQPSIPLVLNPKSLEKQLKILDGRIQVLEGELVALQQLHAACRLLLNQTQPEPAVETPAEDLPRHIQRLLEQHADPLSPDAIADELRVQGIALPEKKPAAVVLAALKKASDRFLKVDGDLWTAQSPEGAPVTHSV